MNSGKRKLAGRVKALTLGVALAYCVTAFVDTPLPIRFAEETPYASQQGAIIDPAVPLILEKNIMKIGATFALLPNTHDKQRARPDSRGTQEAIDSTQQVLEQTMFRQKVHESDLKPHESQSTSQDSRGKTISNNTPRRAKGD